MQPAAVPHIQDLPVLRQRRHHSCQSGLPFPVDHHIVLQNQVKRCTTFSRTSKDLQMLQNHRKMPRIQRRTDGFFPYPNGDALPVVLKQPDGRPRIQAGRFHLHLQMRPALRQRRMMHHPYTPVSRIQRTGNRMGDGRIKRHSTSLPHSPAGAKFKSPAGTFSHTEERHYSLALLLHALSQ